MRLALDEGLAGGGPAEPHERGVAEYGVLVPLKPLHALIIAGVAGSKALITSCPTCCLTELPVLQQTIAHYFGDNTGSTHHFVSSVCRV